MSFFVLGHGGYSGGYSSGGYGNGYSSGYGSGYGGGEYIFIILKKILSQT